MPPQACRCCRDHIGLSRTWLLRKLAEPADGPTHVVTHHVPHSAARHPGHGPNELAPAFRSDCDDLVEAASAAGVAAWIDTAPEKVGCFARKRAATHPCRVGPTDIAREYQQIRRPDERRQFGAKAKRQGIAPRRGYLIFPDFDMHVA